MSLIKYFNNKKTNKKCYKDLFSMCGKCYGDLSDGFQQKNKRHQQDIHNIFWITEATIVNALSKSRFSSANPTKKSNTLKLSGVFDHSVGWHW